MVRLHQLWGIYVANALRQYATDQSELGKLSSSRNVFQRENSELTLQYKSCYKREENGLNRGVSTTEVPSCFQKPEQFKTNQN